MRRPQRLIALFVLVALAGVLGGCASGGSFDPSDLLDFLDTKKKLPGDRKPVFPEGVPGLEQGVPKELYKGAQQQPMEDPAAQAAAPTPPAEQPKGKKGAKGRQQAAVSNPAPAAADPQAQDGEAAAVEEGASAVPPAPKPKKIVRRRTTAPPADDTAPADQPARQSSGQFPAPVPSGSFSR
ncbi:hypothetical protein [Bradyrhizobium sp. STM 3809]|uniref:hypothetical protein n=1 Tax=Bradyrhizobium sp. STM 3809 TaxID=551936 RepID=UPI0002409792|nr:hypothetical protein [Bradyrhizobium sp. STM 3809]CCE01099.1 conserved exported hypothetical protein [Bradyrhizobium sp. STM 3809]